MVGLKIVLVPPPVISSSSAFWTDFIDGTTSTLVIPVSASTCSGISVHVRFIVVQVDLVIMLD